MLLLLKLKSLSNLQPAFSAVGNVSPCFTFYECSVFRSCEPVTGLWDLHLGILTALFCPYFSNQERTGAVPNRYSRIAYSESSPSIQMRAVTYRPLYVAGRVKERWPHSHCTISSKWYISRNILISRQILRELFPVPLPLPSNLPPLLGMKSVAERVIR